MKKIVLHGPSTDEAGNFCDSGTELELVDGKRGEGKAGFISAERAREMVDRGAAVSATASAEIEKAAALASEQDATKAYEDETSPAAGRAGRAAKP